MAQRRTYLDHNATSALRPAARGAMIDALSKTGNPSSVHGEGREARRLIEVARRQVAELAGCSTDGVIFTSGATEAAHMALTPLIASDGAPRPASKLYVLETEHPCVLSGGRFTQEDVADIPVHEDGLIDLDTLDKVLEDHDYDVGAPYVAVQLVNSETGVIQPVAEMAKRVRLRGGYVLCDAVQAFGRIAVDASELGCDFLLISSHKLGGPQGVGALLVHHTILDVPSALRGGGQETNRRAGTENVAAIAGFGAAAEHVAKNMHENMQISELRDSIETALVTICSRHGLLEELTIFGKSAPRVPNTCLFALNGMRAQTALINLDIEGIAVSSGSACSSGKVGSSHVLQAMGVDDDLAECALRVSLGWNSTMEDVEHFERVFAALVKRSGLGQKTSLESQLGDVA
ncbi:MAG: cysteine desulfurase family protein [Pseudomonadota bacterium]